MLDLTGVLQTVTAEMAGYAAVTVAYVVSDRQASEEEGKQKRSLQLLVLCQVLFDVIYIHVIMYVFLWMETVFFTSQC